MNWKKFLNKSSVDLSHQEPMDLEAHFRKKFADELVKHVECSFSQPSFLSGEGGNRDHCGGDLISDLQVIMK